MIRGLVNIIAKNLFPILLVFFFFFFLTLGWMGWFTPDQWFHSHIGHFGLMYSLSPPNRVLTSKPELLLSEL